MKRHALLIFLLLLIGLELLFWQVPAIDLWVSSQFFVPGKGFIYGHYLLPQLSYWTIRYSPFYVIPLLLWLLYASAHWGGRAERPLRRKLWFLLLTLVLGPGLLVNGIFKSESGRARPYQVEQFSGPHRFTAAFDHSNQCSHNCSFVSGHASMGFYFLAFAWVLGRRRWLYYGALIGLTVGMGRVVQGGHFFSDVLFGYPLVLLSAWVSARLVLGRWTVRETAPEA